MMPSTAEDLERKTFFYNVLVPVMNKYGSIHSSNLLKLNETVHLKVLE